MAKISKRLLNEHNKAVALLEKEHLDWDDKEFIFNNYHEGAGKMNNLISAHFTPKQIARSMAHNSRMLNWVDLGAGIGRLSYTMIRENEYHFKDGFIGICVENCTEYYEVGKKLVPECIWINGSIFDQAVIDEIKMIMEGMKLKFSIISNPPYGIQVKGSSDLMHYTGSKFEYKAIEIGAILGAYDGVFLIPQQSAPFRMSGFNGPVNDDKYLTPDYLKFVEQTNLEISPNIGFSTEILDPDELGWKDVSIATEIAIVEYDELNYIPKKTQEVVVKEISNQIKLF